MLSVLLPVRDGAQTLDIALSSLEAQTVQPTECIVVDDGSTDGTREVLEGWQAKWPALRTVRTSGIGIGASLNLGLSQCRFPWIARMDADDRCHPERFERQLKAAAEDRSRALISCQVSHWCDDPSYLGMQRHIEWANTMVEHDALEQALWVDSPLPHPTWLVHQRALEAVGRYDSSLEVPEDYEWLHRFFEKARQDSSLRAHKVGDEPLLDWADSSTRLTRTHGAYATNAFDFVKTRALARRFATKNREIFIFGLGPKAKALFPLLNDALKIKAIVDVNPRHEGILYNGVEVWGAERWKNHPRSSATLVLNCVGTPEARANCETACTEAGLKAGEGFISL